MKKRDRERQARRWAWERIVEALEALVDSDWPFDDLEFEEIPDSEKPAHRDSVIENIAYLRKTFIKKGEPKNGNGGENRRENDR